MVPASSGTGGLVVALAIVGVVISLGFAGFVVYFGDKPVIKFAQKPFCLLFCFGASLSCLRWRGGVRVGGGMMHE